MVQHAQHPVLHHRGFRRFLPCQKDPRASSDRDRHRDLQGSLFGSQFECRFGDLCPWPGVIRLMSYKAWFQCINLKCGATYPLNAIVYQCERCHSLLEVQHDMRALGQRSGASWMKLFEERYKSNEWPYGSGVWGKK